MTKPGKTIAKDEIIKINNSVIHHGKFNDRVYLMKLNPKKISDTITQIEELADSEDYGKIFVKIPQSCYLPFQESSYQVEASIPNFYGGKEGAFFLSKYREKKRKIVEKKDLIENVLETSRNPSIRVVSHLDETGEVFSVRELNEEDVQEMANVYAQVFATYPFPIHDPSFLKQSMNKNVRSFGVFANDNLIAVAACEMDIENSNVEMTDFATLPKYRGKNIAQLILEYMEREMANSGVKTAYTIARAHSYGMNITFSRQEYRYTGTLVNNTNISGHIESMNVWYKSL